MATEDQLARRSLTDPWSFTIPALWGELLEGRNVRIEHFEEDGVLVVRFEMPGIDPDKDVEVTIDNGVLHIKAERREETKGDGQGYRSEFRYRSFARAVSLPAGADEADVKAT